jgi:Protein of unknown function (DUF4239)
MATMIINLLSWARSASGRTSSRQREPKVSLFLSGLPLWIAAILLVVFPTIAAMCGPVLTHRRVGFERLASNNDVAGFKFATVGVIYAVLLAFAVIIVWEKFSDAETAVVQEAGVSATLYRLAAGPEPAAVATRAALGNYLRLAIDREWPLMATGKESREVTQALDALYAAALRLTENGSRQPAIFGEIFKQLDAMTQARRTRLHLATGAVPGVLWLVLVCGAVLTVGFTFFFGTKNLPAQVMMTGILSVLVFMGLLVIVSIDHPFTGPVHVGSEPLKAVVEDFAHAARAFSSEVDTDSRQENAIKQRSRATF